MSGTRGRRAGSSRSSGCRRRTAGTAARRLGPGSADSGPPIAGRMPAVHAAPVTDPPSVRGAPGATSPALAMRPLSRRRLLAGALAGGIATLLAACGVRPSTAPASPPDVASPSPGAPASMAATPSAAASPSPAGPASPSVSPSPSPSLGLMVAGLMVVGFRGLRLGDAPWLRSALAESGLGGVVLFDRDQLTGGERNVASPAQVAALVGEIRAAAGGRHAIVSVDQEGGVVTRLSPTHGFPAVASEATIGRGTVAGARRWGQGIAATLRAAGIDLDLAPVVDLDVDPRSPAIGALGRSFSADPAVVVAMATAEIEALHAAGIRTTLKHFPGIGSASTNTDFGVADVTATWTRAELEPFRRLVAASLADVVMAGHVVDRDLDPRYPASLSPAIVTGILRGELGWHGPVITDDLQAAAITKAFGGDEAVLLALEAGDDLLLFANQASYDPGIVARVVDTVVAAVGSGRLPESRVREAWERVQALG